MEVPSVRIPAGSEMAVEVRGSKTDFRLWTPWLGAGTSDVAVRRVWVTGESSAIAWLAASPAAAASVNSWSAGVGLAALRLTQTLTVGAADETPFVRMSRLAEQYLYPGGLAVLPVANAPLGLNVGNVKVQIGNATAIILDVGEGNVTVRVPPELAPGAHMVEMTLAGVKALPAAIEIRPVPPVILGAFRPSGTPITTAAPARAGDIILLAVTRLGDAVEIPASEVTVSTGQVRHEVRAVRPNPGEPGTHLLEIRLAAAEAANGSIPLVVARNGAYNLEPFLLPYVE